MTGAAPHIPVLTTGRLTLRAPILADFEGWATFFASERAVHEGGPLGRVDAWRRWAADVALWHLRGYGAFTVADRSSGEWLGEVGLYQPEGFPEAEFGWLVAPEAEGRGIAFEAALAALAWVKATLDAPHVVSIVGPANQRSIRLALRLGGTVDSSLSGIDPGDVVIRHDLRAAA